MADVQDRRGVLADGADAELLLCVGEEQDYICKSREFRVDCLPGAYEVHGPAKCSQVDS